MDLKVEPNGCMVLSTKRATITVHPDGTITISSLDPVQLTGACAAKLDNVGDQDAIKAVTDALLRRIDMS
jgi:hypothetical protein